MKRRTTGRLGIGLIAGALVLCGVGLAAAQAPYQHHPGGMHGSEAHTGRPARPDSGPMCSGGMGGTGDMPHNPGRMTGFGMGMMDDASRHFIEEMIPHHDDAVAMAALALDQAEHEELRLLAAAIIETQTAEIEKMRGWYQDWYGTDVPPGHMAAMMSHDMTALGGAISFDKAFIEAMIPHHLQAVHMATMALRFAEQGEMQALLQAIVTGQTAEIEQMRGWYRDWYGAEAPARGMMPMHGPRMGR